MLLFLFKVLWLICTKYANLRFNITSLSHVLGVSPDVLPWIFISSSIQSIDTGMTSSVWAVSKDGKVYVVHGRSLIPVHGRSMKHVSAGEAGVWAVAQGGKVYFRKGVLSSNPTGTKWVKVSGQLLQVDSGPTGVVYAVDTSGHVRCRAKIMDQRPEGSFWRTVHSSFSASYVSCGSYGCWASDTNANIWFRFGVSQYHCQGTKWERVSGSLQQLEVGEHGEMWGVHTTSTLWNRVHVSADHPTGKGWKRVGSHGFKHVTVGRAGLFVITDQGNVYRKHVCENGNIVFQFMSHFLIFTFAKRALSHTNNNDLTHMHNNDVMYIVIV